MGNVISSIPRLLFLFELRMVMIVVIIITGRPRTKKKNQSINQSRSDPGEGLSTNKHVGSSHGVSVLHG